MLPVRRTMLMQALVAIQSTKGLGKCHSSLQTTGRCVAFLHHTRGQGRIQDFVLGGAYRDGNGGVPLQTCQGVWESAVSTIIPAPKP